MLCAMYRSCEKSNQEAGAPLHQQLSLQVLVHVSVTQFGSHLICTIPLLSMQSGDKVAEIVEADCP